jgi:hypothetical protein
LQNQLNEKIKLKNETEKKKKDAEKILTKTRNDYENINSPRKETNNKNNQAKSGKVIFTEQNAGLNLSANELSLKIKNTEKEIKRFEQNIITFDKEIKKLLVEKQKVDNDVNDKKTWNDIRLEEFSLYLLKPETTANEIKNKENQLLLLDVRP